MNNGTLTVTPAGLTVVAADASRAYGQSNPVFTASYVGFVNGETNTVLTGTLIFDRAPGTNVGSYLITPSGLTSDNYALTFHPGTLTITAPPPAILSLTGAGLGEALITWSVVSNASYRVQFKSDLNATNWTSLIGDVTASGSTASKTVSGTGPHRFYRIQVLP